MALEIEFLDGRPVMEVGQRTRLRVLQQDAAGRKNAMRLEQVAFSFSPVTWGRVERTNDPAIGLLEVVEVVEPDDLLLAPVYRIEASLTNYSEQTIQPERRVRLIATAVEVELGFEVGFGDKWRRFETQQLKRPIDWSRARTDDPARSELVVREGHPYLRLRSLQDLPAQVTISFPNGEAATLRLEGRLGAWEPGHGAAPVLFPAVAAPAPAAAPATVATVAPATGPTRATAPAPTPDPEIELTTTSLELEPVPEETPADSEPDRPALPVEAPLAAAEESPEPAAQEPAAPVLPLEVLQEELGKLKRYVGSFSGALRAQPEGETAARIRERIAREVERVWGLLLAASEEVRAELSGAFLAATEAVPEAKRVAAGLTQGAQPTAV